MYVTVKNLNCLYKHTLKMWLRSELLLRSYGVLTKCPWTVLTRLIGVPLLLFSYFSVIKVTPFGIQKSDQYHQESTVDFRDKSVTNRGLLCTSITVWCLATRSTTVSEVWQKLRNSKQLQQNDCDTLWKALQVLAWLHDNTVPTVYYYIIHLLLQCKVPGGVNLVTKQQ